MMDGKTYDKLISTLRSHIVKLIKEDDDGFIEESEFHVICNSSKEMVKKKFPDHADSVSVGGEVEGDKLSFRVVYHHEDTRTAYDRTVVIGVRSVLKDLDKSTLAQIERLVDKRLEKALKEKGSK